MRAGIGTARALRGERHWLPIKATPEVAGTRTRDKRQARGSLAAVCPRTALPLVSKPNKCMHEVPACTPEYSASAGGQAKQQADRQLKAKQIAAAAAAAARQQEATEATRGHRQRANGKPDEVAVSPPSVLSSSPLQGMEAEPIWLRRCRNSVSCISVDSTCCLMELNSSSRSSPSPQPPCLTAEVAC